MDELLTAIAEGQNVIQSIDQDNRILEFIISSETPIEGRGYVVRQEWDVSQWKKNPVFLWMHDAYGFTMSGGMPVGKILVDTMKQTTIETEKYGKVKATTVKVQFPSKEESELGNHVYRMYAAGYLHAVSINFVPQKIIEPSRHGELREFYNNKLYELSAVAIGADEEAFIRRAQATDHDPKEAKQLYDELMVIQSKIPNFRQDVNGGQVQGEFLDCGEHSVLVRCNDDVAMQGFKQELEKRSGWYDENRKALLQANKVMTAYMKSRGEEVPEDLEQAYVRMGELLEQGGAAPQKSDPPAAPSSAPETPGAKPSAKPAGVTLSQAALQAGLADVKAQVDAAALAASKNGMSTERVKIMSEQLYKQLAGEFFAKFSRS